MRTNLGLAMMGALCFGGLVLARLQGLSVGRILLRLLCVLVGGVVGGMIGAAFVLFAVINSASGAGPVPGWLFIVVLAGSAAGGLVGLRTLDRATSRPSYSRAAWATAMAGFTIGIAVSIFALLLVQESSGRVVLWMILSPLSIAAATVAGYSFAPPWPRDRSTSDPGTGGTPSGFPTDPESPGPRVVVRPERRARSFSLWSIASATLLVLGSSFLLFLLSFLPRGTLAGPAEGASLTFLLTTCFFAAWSCTLLGIVTGWIGVRRSRRGLAWPWAIMMLHAMSFLGMTAAVLIAIW